MNNQDSKVFWTSHFIKNDENYPSELLVRLLKGNFKNFNFNKNYEEQTVVDLGTGSGKNLILLKALNFKKIYGIDISIELIEALQEKFNFSTEQVEFLQGMNNLIPLPDNSVDLLVSWGSSYYINENCFSLYGNFSYEKHLEEFRRVIKPDCFLLLDIPQPKGEVYKNTVSLFYEDYLIDENGIILKYFNGLSEAKKLIKKYFKIIHVISTKQIIFNKDYSRYTFVCKKYI